MAKISIQRSRIQGVSELLDDFVPDHVVYGELDDEVTDLYQRAKHLPQGNLALVLPRRAQVFQSIVNLRILHKKLLTVHRAILVVSSDPQGAALAKKAGFFVTDALVKTDSALPNLPQKILRGENPVRILKKRMSLSEVIRHDPPESRLRIIWQRLSEFLKRKKQNTFDQRIVIFTKNKQALFTLVLVTLLLGLTIGYIALPGATITITPRTTLLDATFNVTFAEGTKNQTLNQRRSNAIVIGSYPLSPPAFSRTIRYHATGKKFKGENARGSITVVNTSQNPWDLVRRTRFQTEDGIVFRMSNDARVPPARGNEPGTLDVAVVADPYDEKGQPIGARGNIPPSRFFLPGIKNADNKKKLYGVSKAAMQGGITDVVKVVSAEDIVAAKEQVKREIAAWTKEDMQQYLQQKNISERTNLTLLTDSQILKTVEPQILIDDKLVGTHAEQFDVAVTYRATGLAYDRGELVETLRERMANRADPDKKIVRIEEERIDYRFLDEQPSAGRVRLTTTMHALQTFDLREDSENGRRFFKKISEHIAGMKVSEAHEYLQRQSNEIAQVEIKTWPVWAPTIPNIAEHIEFVVQEDLF